MKRVLYLAASLLMILLSCNKQGTDNKKNNNNNTEESLPITIDGKFEDWATVKPFVAKNSSNSIWDAVKELRVYAEGDYVFYYIRFNPDVISEYLGQNDVLPARINLNTDGEFDSGYQNYFLQGYDFIIEISLGNGAGGWGAGDNSTLYQRLNDSWKELLGEYSGLTYGAGSGHEYELCLDRSIFNNAAAKSDSPMPMGDTFQTSMRFYETTSTGKWEELSNIPNTDDGYGNLLEVTFAK